MGNKKVVIYTCNYGGYDRILEPLSPELNIQADFYCFINDTVQSKIYQKKSNLLQAEDDILLSRHPKINPHLYFSEYEISIYIDANLRLTLNDLEPIVNYALNSANIACWKHNYRCCIYDEAKICIARGLDNRKIIEEQILRYREEGFPEHFGLGANSLIIRRHNDPEVIAFSEAWWQEYINNSKRDQLSSDYIRWKLGTNIFHIPLNISSNAVYVRYKHHKSRPEATEPKINKATPKEIIRAIAPPVILKLAKQLIQRSEGETVEAAMPSFYGQSVKTDNQEGFERRRQKLFDTNLLCLQVFPGEKLNIIDVGCAEGQSIVYFAHLYQNATITAVEPHPHRFKLLNDNVAEIEGIDIQLIKKAVTDTIAPFQPYYYQMGGPGSLLPHPQSPTEVVESSTIRLSELLTAPFIHLLKLTSPGYEAAIVAEAATYIHKVRNIFIEFKVPLEGPSRLGELIQLLEEFHFRLEIRVYSIASNRPFEYRAENKGYSSVLWIFATNHRLPY